MENKELRIISLNTWGGRAGKENLFKFFKENKDTDIFCLQEIWSAPYEDLDGKPAGGLLIEHKNIMTYGKQEISSILNDHFIFFNPHHLDNYGLLMFVNKNLEIKNSGELFVHKHKGFIPEGDVGHHARNIQYVTLINKDKEITVINFHGLWNGKSKDDSEDRIKQSQNIIDFIRTLKGEVILTGDFNLNPDTESIKMIENSGLINLIKEKKITSTRTSLYIRRETNPFADYTFVSKDVEVKSFEIMPDEVSDHAAMKLVVNV